MADSNRFIVQVFVGALSQLYEALSVEASKQTTSEEIVSCIVERLCLTNAVEYELAEVVGQECKERRLGPQECPVALMLLWPRKSFDSHNSLLSSEPSTYEDQHRFYLREKLSDAHWTDSFTMDPQLIRDYFYLFLYQPKDRDYPDLCQLPDLNEQTLLENLRARFSNGHIYTYVGSILIAVNPFKFYPIYNPKYVKLYQNRRLGDMPPHIFAIADAAYHSMLREKCNQCIVISGESGSGKTESTNFLLHHLTALSQKGSHGSGVEQTILSAGPVLEAFGNAKTAHNNNSSRFGKFIQVNYKENGMVHGAVVQKYLLEKSRICSQGRTERNYHVFYYLLAGASDIEKKALHLKRAEDYNYLSRCAFNELDNVDESYEFSRLKQSMEMVGFSAEKQRRLFAVLSAVLLLGNVEFAPRKSAYHHDEAVGVRNPEVVSLISELLRVKEETLMAALTAKRARASGETLVINYRLPEAIAARDAMAKCLYGALFDWIVLQVNHALLSKKDTLREHQGHSIGVLDIFGFEDFGVFNSFEQFCINYANEHLQFYFNQHVFKYEQEEYRKEGIKWKSIDFMDNTGCLNLIEGKPNGLLCILDDQCNFPGATNETLLQKFNSVHKENIFYEVPQKREAAFIVRHYAGKVKYQVAEVREKNLDLMRQDIVSVLKNSSMAFVRELVGADPVAVFRWAIVRAFFRAYFAFNEAGTRHRLVRVDGSKANLMHHRYRNHPPNESIISYTRPGGAIFGSNQKANVPNEYRHSAPPRQNSGYSKKENDRRDSNARKKSFSSGNEDVEMSSGRKESVAGLERVLCPSEARVLERANQIVMKNKSFRPRERGKKGLKNLETVKTLAGRTQSYGSSQMKGVGTRKQPLTVTAQFQQSLQSLMVTLNQANPFFIRCIKSNSNKVPNEFDAETVQRQLRYTGMLETVRIRQAGYNVRLTYDEFIQLYRILLPKGLVSSQSDVRDFLLTLNLNRDNYQLGHTKVFLRESEKVKLDYRLHQQIIGSIVAIQRWFRASLERKRFVQLKCIIINLQSHCRAYLVRQKVNHIQMMNSAAKDIQRAWRGYKVRSWYVKLLSGVRVIQAHARGTLVRHKFRALLAQRHKQQLQLKREVTKPMNKSIIHLNADDSYVLNVTSDESAQKKRDLQTCDEISRQLKNLPPLETEIPKRRSIPKKNKTSVIDDSQKQISFDESIQEHVMPGASMPRKGSSESLTSLKSTDSTASTSKPTLQHRAKKQIQALIGGGRKVEKLGNNSAAHSDSETDETSNKQKDQWKRAQGDTKSMEPVSTNKPLARSPHIMLHRYSSGDNIKPDKSFMHHAKLDHTPTRSFENQRSKEPEVVRPSRQHKAGREISFSVGDHEMETHHEASPALRWSRASESPEFRSRVDTRSSEGSSESSLMSPRDSDWPQPVFQKMGPSAAQAASAGSQKKRHVSPQRREQMDLKRRNSDPAKSMAATAIVSTDPLNTPEPEIPKQGLDVEYKDKGTIVSIASHRFRKVTRFNKEDKCVFCGKCMDFINQGYKCTECKQLFHTKCIQNGGVLQMPCQHASGGGKPGRRKHRKHSRAPYDLSKMTPPAGKFNLQRTSEFTDSTDKIISDARELQLMQDFITNKIYKIESEEGKKPSVVDRVFKQALKEFKDNLLSTYSIVNKQGVEALNIKYKDLIANFLQVMETVCYQENTKEDFPVTMGVNAFRGFMNEFMAQNRLEEKPKAKRKKEKKRKTEDPIPHFGHMFQLTIINIPTACEICTSFFMWPIERGLVCQICKLTCHRKCYTKVKQYCGKEESKYDAVDGTWGHVFGAPLARLAEDEGKVPVVVDRLITSIELYGLYTEGLYRKSGVSSKVRELKARIEENIEDVVFENYQVHVLASLLKSFFRDMPEPLLTFECYEDFLRAGNLTDPQDRVSTLFAILKKLPRANFVLMERLIFHLARVALNEDANRMNASALAIVFAPCILRTNKVVPAQDSLNDISRQTQCVETIIQEQLRKVRSTLADIETLDTACHTATNRLSTLRSSKVFQPEDFPQQQQASQSTAGGAGSAGDTASAGEEDEEALLTHHIHAMQKEKALLTSTLPSLSHATSDDDLLSTDLDGSLDDVASATSHFDDSLPAVPACRVVPTPRTGRAATNNKNNTSHCNNQKQKCLQPAISVDRQKKLPSICILSNCYKIVQQAANKSDLIEVGPKKHWNLLWTDAILTVQQCRDLKRYQMVNYFPGIGEIARKDLLARNLARMQKHFPEDYDFFPKTWWLPADLGDLLIHARSRRGETYIVKPGCGSQGRGILITKNVAELEAVQQSICQTYIPRPLLIDGFKFDIRIYTVITSCDPLRIFVYNEGIVRFATHKYAEPMTENINNVFMHLTNYAINKNHCGFIQGEDGSKRRISALNSWLAEQEIDAPQLWNKIDCDIVKTIITSSPALKHQYHLCFPKHPQACFILLGFDVLLDVDLKPYIIEVNRCPSLNIDSVIDEEVKEQLLVDIFNLLNLKRLDQQRVQGEERRRVYQRTQRTIDRLARRLEFPLSENWNTTIADSIESQISWEEAHMGNFRKVYPTEDGAKYDNFFIEASNTLYQETAASRARREFSQLQKNDAGFDEDNCIETACDENDEGSSGDESCNKASNTKKMIRGRIPILNSFFPQYISKAEERDRLRGLDKRESLVRTLNLKAHLINALRINGDFRAEEEAILEQKAISPRIVPPVSPGASLHVRATAPSLWPRKDLLPPLDRQNISLFNNGTLYTSFKKQKLILPYQTESFNELRVVCNEVSMAIRPLPSRVSRWASLNQNLSLVSHKSQANCKIVCSSNYN